MAAQVWALPAETLATLLRFETATGLLLFVELPLPSSPLLFRPQHCTVPLLRTAQLCPSPVEIPDALDRDVQITGVLLVVKSCRFPSSP